MAHSYIRLNTMRAITQVCVIGAGVGAGQGMRERVHMRHSNALGPRVIWHLRVGKYCRLGSGGMVQACVTQSYSRREGHHAGAGGGGGGLGPGCGSGVRVRGPGRSCRCGYGQR